MMTLAAQDALEQHAAFLRHGKWARVARRPFRFLWSKTVETAARSTSSPIGLRARTFWGDRMHVMFPDQVATTIYRYGYFEIELTRIILECVKPGMVFFDVGAHMGYFSMLAGRLVGASGQVHAFEPTPSTFEILQRNLAGLPQAVANNLAAYSRAGTLEFRDFGAAFSAYNSLASDKFDEVARRRVKARVTTVNAVTLDAYSAERSVIPSFLKIDAEGAELEILHGMADLLSNARPSMTLEVGDKGGEHEVRSRDVVDYLIEREYVPIECDGRLLRRHTARERYEYANLLFAPREADIVRRLDAD